MAYGVTTDDSSIKTKSRKSHHTHKKSKETDDDDSAKTKGKKMSKKKKEKEKKKNDCPYCKKYHCRSPPLNAPNKKCFWNKKYKGYCPRHVCDELRLS